MKYLINFILFENYGELLEVIFNNATKENIFLYVSMLTNIYKIDDKGNDILDYTIMYEEFELFKHLLNNYNWDIYKNNNTENDRYLESIINNASSNFIETYILHKNFDTNKLIYGKPIIFDIYNYFGSYTIIKLLKKYPNIDFTVKIDNKYFFEEYVYNKTAFEVEAYNINILINSNIPKLSYFVKKETTSKKFNL